MQELELIQQQLNEINQKLNTLFIDNIANCIIGYDAYLGIPEILQQMTIEQKINILNLYFNDIDGLKKLVQTKDISYE